MYAKVINIDGVEKTFETPQAFLDFAKIIYNENETEPSSIHFEPENINNALEYINEYCPDLTLIEL